MHNHAQIALIIIGLLFVGFCILVFLLRWMILRDIKYQMNSNRKPMVLCDRGHLYPKEFELSITVEGAAEPIAICPLCYKQNLKGLPDAAARQSDNRQLS